MQNAWRRSKRSVNWKKQAISQCSRVRILCIFQVSRNMTTGIYVFLKWCISQCSRVRILLFSKSKKHDFLRFFVAGLLHTFSQTLRVAKNSTFSKKAREWFRLCSISNYNGQAAPLARLDVHASLQHVSWRRHHSSSLSLLTPVTAAATAAVFNRVQRSKLIASALRAGIGRRPSGWVANGSVTDVWCVVFSMCRGT